MAKGKMGFEGGKYSAKSGDLSKSQLKRAGATKAAAKQPVDIGRTKRIETGALKGRTVGPGGKPLTGSVKLANGQMAVYKAGKRVINVKRSKDGNGSGGTGNGSDTSAAKRAAAAAAAKKAAAAAASKVANSRNEVAAATRMASQNAATAAAAPSVAAAKKKAANISARNKRISARATERSSERKAAIEREKRPSLRGAYKNVNSYGDKTVADFVKWSARTSNSGYKAISDYFR